MVRESVSEAATVASYLKLLLDFRALPEAKRNRTFMEVSGYPHYENVCTNILRFYFDPEGDHGLGDLLISAFIRMAKVEELPTLKDVSVRTQQVTDRGNSMDIVIDGDAFTIGIENKIFHCLANDLEDYSQYIDRLAGEKPVVVKAVLGLRRESGPLEGGFVSFTYGQFWRQVRGMLGHYISRADPKWVTYLVDLMDTTANLAGENMELRKTDQFFTDHHELIEKMLEERNAFLDRLNEKVANLAAIVEETMAPNVLSAPPWIYRNNTLVFDFVAEKEFQIAFDLVLQPSGWDLQLFGRNRKSRAKLAKVVKRAALRKRMSGVAFVDDRYNLQHWPVSVDMGELRDAITSWLGSMETAINQNKK